MTSMPKWMKVPGLIVGAVALLGLIMMRAGTMSAGNPPVFSQAPYATAIASAREQGKMVLVKFTADWCPPCKEMNRVAFRDDGVIEAINKAGIALAVDTDKQPIVGQWFAITAMPTMVMLRLSDGKTVEIARHVGYLGAPELTAFVTKAAAEAKDSAGIERPSGLTADTAGTATTETGR